ncbi:MAG: methionine--tRNA ligase [Candidatus Omnitrophica bacterium]|nr:methionine--tRNA ligase [Candidatus Omnitrophota bacterium]
MENACSKPEKASKFYLTTPIYYVNASPHIGHAYTTVIGDCIARFKRMKGFEVFYLTGTDEHGEKIKKAAEKNGKEVKNFVDEVSQNFVTLWKFLNVSYDFFIRTTDSFHIQVVQKSLQQLFEKGDIYKAKYRGFYCMPCELFWNESQIKEAGGCPDCKREVSEIEEDNYFFKMSKYESWLKEYLKANPDFVKPKIRYNEVMGFLDNNKLGDLCISRPKKRVSWGIPLPFDTEYVVYVWFDALLNYLSGVGFLGDDKRFKQLWPADIHLMAKDILKQHAVFWPIMLRALDLEQPRVVFAHGWWKIGEEKISKSRGNVVNPFELVQALGLKGAGVDALRYFLLREVPAGADGNFSWEALVSRTNSDLANDLGNLVYRTLNMAEKYFSGTVESKSLPVPEEFKAPFLDLETNYAQCMEELDFPGALEKIFKCISVMNKYIEDKKPWAMWKEKKEDDVRSFLAVLFEGIRIVAFYLYPFIPYSSASILRQVGIKKVDYNLTAAKWSGRLTFSISRESPLFPRIDVS